MPGLGITCGTIRREVGHYLGFDRDPASWSANEIQDVWDIVDRGLRQFYRPPRLEGEVIAHQWTFLRPLLYLKLQAGVEDYLMPPAFAGLDGGIYFVNDEALQEQLQVVNEGRILHLRQSNWTSTTTFSPRYVALTPLASDHVAQQRWKLMVWPPPDEAYTLRCKYYARQDGFREDTAVPAGAYEHAEAILASCIAIAESREGDEMGHKMEQFMMQLRASVDYDRRVSVPETLGYNGDCSSDDYDYAYPYRSVGSLITLASHPIDDGEGGGGGGGGGEAEDYIQTLDGEPLVTQGGAEIVPQ